MKIRKWAIGAFIIAGFAFFTAILFQIGNRQKAFHKHIEVYTEFSNLGGLASGAKVRVSGLDSGQIKTIELPKDPAGKFRLKLQVEERAHPMIRTDSIASIETEGVVGDKFILIKKGTEQARELPAGGTLRGKEPFDLTALMDKSTLLLNDVHGSVNEIRGRVDTALASITRTVDHADGMINGVRPDIQRIANDGTQITGKINILLADLNAGKGPAGMLLLDDATRQQLQATLTNVQHASANIDQVSDHANQLVNDFQSRQLVARMQATLDNVQSMSLELDTTIKQALAQDSIGRDGASNLRDTLSNLNRSTANLAEDTEALKHNFFLRGFFKKRGFYNLDQLTRSDYLEACDQQKNAPARKWLDAASLLTSDGNGKEELSVNGRQLIDQELAPVIDTLPDHVIVVEGYATSGSPSQEYVQSKKRADLVRRYLESRYHLNHSDVGIVPLRNQPPERSGRQTWDGAAIALLPDHR